MESILGSVVWRFFKWLPPFILRRIFSEEWMSKNIYIDIRPRHTSVEIWQPDNPKVNIYLEVRNNTHFRIEVDRILLDFIYGGELAKPQHFKREYLNPGERREIYFTGNIDQSRIDNLARNYQRGRGRCSLGVLAECNSKLHKFCIEKTLEGVKPEIANEHLLETANNSSKRDAVTGAPS